MKAFLIGLAGGMVGAAIALGGVKVYESRLAGSPTLAASQPPADSERRWALVKLDASDIPELVLFSDMDAYACTLKREALIAGLPEEAARKLRCWTDLP